MYICYVVAWNTPRLLLELLRTSTAVSLTSPVGSCSFADATILQRIGLFWSAKEGGGPSPFQDRLLVSFVVLVWLLVASIQSGV